MLRREKTVHLHINSQTEKLILVRDFISGAARDAGFDEETASKIMLAVDEACTNIIKHAYEFKPSNDIDIEVTSSEKKFEIIIKHSGKSFDPHAVKSPDMKEYLRKYQRGGLGIHLIRSLMDEVNYSTLANGKSEVRLIKFLPVPIPNKR